MTEMRAALFDAYGGPEVLYVGQWPVPEVHAGQVLVRVVAATVNGGELAGRAGKVSLVTGRRFPQRVGIDFVGDVERVAPDVEDVSPGDRVWGIMDEKAGFGSNAEYVAVAARRISRAPLGLGAGEAATLLAGGTTAIVALRDHARMRPGESVLVRGASGGVGSLAVQVAKLFGARVTGLAGGRNLDFVSSLGADEVIDYTTTRIDDLGRFDVIIDIAGTEQARLRRHLAPGGRMVAVNLDVDHLAASIGTVIASTVHGRGRIRFFRGSPERELFEELAGYADQGLLRPVVDWVYPLARIADAHRALEAGGVRGKIVIEIS